MATFAIFNYQFNKIVDEALIIDNSSKIYLNCIANHFFDVFLLFLSLVLNNLLYLHLVKSMLKN